MWQRIWLLIKELWRLVRGEDDPRARSGGCSGCFARTADG